jgi:hypothetical protein
LDFGCGSKRFGHLGYVVYNPDELFDFRLVSL